MAQNRGGEHEVCEDWHQLARVAWPGEVLFAARLGLFWRRSGGQRCCFHLCPRFGCGNQRGRGGRVTFHVVLAPEPRRVPQPRACAIVFTMQLLRFLPLTR